LSVRKQPSQQRGIITLGAIFEGAAQVLERGLPFTTNTIAKRAGVSIGTLYQYFPSKEAIAAGLSRKARAALVDAISAAAVEATNLPMRDGLRHIFEASIHAESQRPRVALEIDKFEERLSLEVEASALAIRIRDRLSVYLRRCFPSVAPSAIIVLADDLRAMSSAFVDAARHRGELFDDTSMERTTQGLWAISSSRFPKDIVMRSAISDTASR
jgi:AcrR family transcriptional regulator